MVTKIYSFSREKCGKSMPRLSIAGHHDGWNNNNGANLVAATTMKAKDIGNASFVNAHQMCVCLFRS
jgi:hypothetical protein